MMVLMLFLVAKLVMVVLLLLVIVVVLLLLVFLGFLAYRRARGHGSLRYRRLNAETSIDPGS